MSHLLFILNGGVALFKPGYVLLYNNMSGRFFILSNFNFPFLLLIFLLLGFVIILFWFGRKIFYKKVSHLVNKQVEEALKIKEKALRIGSGFDSRIISSTAKGNKVKSIKYKSVSVLFADIQGFTKIVEHLNPDLLIDELDDFFFKFDSVVEKYGIEKIKTIGDAYMAAGGIPEKSRTHAIQMVRVAMEIQRFMYELRSKKDLEHQEYWELRIGIHTGPVIAGRIGRNKTALDIWGDTVNIASRMESSGTAGEINITGTTYQLVNDFFVCEYRGKMPIKYKGEIDMYFIKGIKEELSEEGEGLLPNKLFNVRLQHIRYQDLEEAILNRLEKDLPEWISYHNVTHTIDVITQVEIIARGENVSEEELLLLKTAALMHDTGFLFSYSEHEKYSIDLCNEILKRFQYSDEQIQVIIDLIEGTRSNKRPSGKLGEILKDADLDYLGRTDFLKISDNLYKELQQFNGKMTMHEWIKKQYDFISKHRYYTKTARRMRQINKDRQLNKLRQILPDN